MGALTLKHTLCTIHVLNNAYSMQVRIHFKISFQVFIAKIVLKNFL